MRDFIKSPDFNVVCFKIVLTVHSTANEESEIFLLLSKNRISIRQSSNKFEMSSDKSVLLATRS